MRGWRNWQTHYLEVVAPQGLEVRVLSRALEFNKRMKQGFFILVTILALLVSLFVIDLVSTYAGGIFFLGAALGGSLIALLIGIGLRFVLPLILQSFLFIRAYRSVRVRTGRTSPAIFVLVVAILYMVAWPLLELGRLSENRVLRYLQQNTIEEMQFGTLTPILGPVVRKVFVTPELVARDRKVRTDFENGFQFETKKLCFLRDSQDSSWVAPYLFWEGLVSWPDAAHPGWQPTLVYDGPGGYTSLFKTIPGNMFEGTHFIQKDQNRGGITRGIFNLQTNSINSDFVKTTNAPVALTVRVDEPAVIRFIEQKEVLDEQVQEKMRRFTHGSPSLAVSEFVRTPELVCDEKVSDFIKPYEAYGML